MLFWWTGCHVLVFLMYCFFFEVYGDPRDLHVLTHSFPTRRSSDLPPRPQLLQHDTETVVEEALVSHLLRSNCPVTGQPDWGSVQISYRGPRIDRSEEHTSELQSLMRISYAVFCLKKTKKTYTI